MSAVESFGRSSMIKVPHLGACIFKDRPGGSFSVSRPQRIPLGNFMVKGSVFKTPAICPVMIAMCPVMIAMFPVMIAMFPVMMVQPTVMSSDLRAVDVRKFPLQTIKSAVDRMDEKEVTRPAAEHMVGADRPSMVHNHEGVEIVQDIIARKIEIIELERIRDPCIEENISRGR